MEENVSPASSRPRRANELGPTGMQVAAGVFEARKSLSLTTEQVAERMIALGRPIQANTITKIEKGQRRVDADDLVALALALETRPDALLLPLSLAGEVALTTTTTVTGVAAWLWANGRRPLEVPDGDDGSAVAAYQLRAQPTGMRDWRPASEEYGPGLYHEGTFIPWSEKEGDADGRPDQEDQAT